MCTIRIYIFIYFLLIITFNLSFAQTDTLYLVVNKNNVINELSINELSQYYLAQKKFWRAEQPVQLLINDSDKNLFKKFTALLNTTPAQFTRKWLTIILTGKSSPPLNLSSDQATISYILHNKNAIGFVNKPSNKVKVIKIRK